MLRGISTPRSGASVAGMDVEVVVPKECHREPIAFDFFKPQDNE
jgi:hypothetical protein